MRLSSAAIFDPSHPDGLGSGMSGPWYSVRCLIKLEIQFRLPLLLTMMLHVTAARVKAIVSNEKKLISVWLKMKDMDEERSECVFNSAECFSLEISATEMYLMAGDCGNVTHLKTHCVAWPLLTSLSDLTVREKRGERSRVIVQPSLITHLYISHKGKKHTITHTKN